MFPLVTTLIMLCFVLVVMGFVLMFLGLERDSDILFYGGVTCIILFIALGLLTIAIAPEGENKNSIIIVPIIIPWR